MDTLANFPPLHPDYSTICMYTSGKETLAAWQDQQERRRWKGRFEVRCWSAILIDTLKENTWERIVL